MLTEESLDYAFGRIEDFYTVQKSAPFAEKVEAVDVLLGSLGLSHDLKSHLLDWIERFADDSNAGSVMLGLLIGLFADDYQKQ